MKPCDVLDLPEARTVLPAPYGRQDWLTRRAAGIGGSDAATIVGLNPFHSPLGLYLEKTGELVNDEPEPGPDDVRWWGHRLEDDMAEAFTETTGHPLADPPGLLAHVQRPWQLASVDRYVTNPAGEPIGVLEMKTTGWWDAREWEDDEVPARALVQLQHYLAVTGLHQGWVAGLIAGQKFVVKHVHRDPDLIGVLTEAEAEFWERIQTRTPPEPNGTEPAAAAIRARYPRADDDKAVVLDPEALDVVHQLRAVEDTYKLVKTQREALRQRLQMTLGTAAIGYDGERPAVRWTNVTACRWDTKALEAAHPELADEFKKPSTTRRFTLAP